MNQDLTVKVDEIYFDDVFNTRLPNEELKFLFEAKYEPFSQYLSDELKATGHGVVLSVGLCMTGTKTPQ
ncbi:hypothetical protein [uncultured Desulfobacter sp.]|uniref:hypothetical protein n=1 Tax=uncultured Desulfobacter sp. TaxID=240139 RepID=UPI002AAA771F|nr:hypothetical protein [uncultured Desulfobacter sp.]